MSPLLAKFCRQFFAHFYEFYHSLDEVAGLGLRGLTAEQQKAFAPVLDELTSERYSDNDLVELWKTSPACVWLTNGQQIRELFKLARNKIG